MDDEGKAGIAGSMWDVTSGKVDFYSKLLPFIKKFFEELSPFVSVITLQ